METIYISSQICHTTIQMVVHLQFSVFSQFSCRGVFITDSVEIGSQVILGASTYPCKKFDLVFLKIVKCDFD